MASVGRALGRSFLSTTRSALRACKASGSEAVGGTVKGKSPCAPSYVPSPSSSSLPPMRRPVSYFTRCAWILPLLWNCSSSLKFRFESSQSPLWFTELYRLCAQVARGGGSHSIVASISQRHCVISLGCATELHGWCSLSGYVSCSIVFPCFNSLHLLSRRQRENYSADLEREFKYNHTQLQ